MKSKFIKIAPKKVEYVCWVINCELPLKEMPEFVQEQVRHLKDNPRGHGIRIDKSEHHECLSQLSLFWNGFRQGDNGDLLYLNEDGQPMIIPQSELGDYFDYIGKTTEEEF